MLRKSKHDDYLSHMILLYKTNNWSKPEPYHNHGHDSTYRRIRQIIDFITPFAILCSCSSKGLKLKTLKLVMVKLWITESVKGIVFDVK